MCALQRKTQSETTNGAPERPEVLPKRSTSKSNQKAQTKHQKVQSETTSRAPERPEVLPKRSTSKSNQRAQMKHQKAQKEHQKIPVLLNTKLAQSTSQYYFVLQSLHKLLPSTTVYCKACKKYFPALLCTTKLAKSISQYFVLQSCRKYFPVLLCSAKLAQSTFHYYFALTTHAYVDGTMELPQA